MRDTFTQQADGLRYLDVGEQAEVPLFLLHGVGNSLEFWRPVIDNLGAERRAIAVDLPGFGGSRGLADPLNRSQWVGALTGMLDHLDVGRVDVVGHSFGGLIAIALAIGAPDRVRSLTLVDAILFDAADMIRRPRTALHAPVRAAALAAQFIGGVLPMSPMLACALTRYAAVRRLFFWPFVAHPSGVDGELLRAAVWGNRGGRSVFIAARLARRVDLRELAAAVRQPTDIVWGARDRLISRADIEDARRLLPIRRLVEFENCGHWPLVEQPARLAAVLTRSE
jgi:pimeloyl-ACP methyl ester carboxylesterase